MNVFFRLKLQYLSENQKTGKIEKKNFEVLAEAVNYTEAEKIVETIIEREDLNRYSQAKYDIKREDKMSVNDFLFNDNLSTDNATICRLIQCYFEDEKSGIYMVEAVIFGDEAVGTKDEKIQVWVPAKDIYEAQEYAKKHISQIYTCGSDDFSIAHSKFDKADTVLLTQETFTRKNEL